MSGQADILVQNLTRYGLSSDEAIIYTFLLKAGKTSALKLSKDLKIARTKIYRLLEKLIDKGFVIEEVKNYGTKYQAASYDKLNLILAGKEEELIDLKENAPKLFNMLAALTLQTGEESKILHYRGLEGLKQVTWNSTKVEGNFRIYEINSLHYLVDDDFAEKTRAEYAKKRDNKFFQLTNHKSFEDFTKVSAHIDQWEVRYIPKKDLDIRFEIQIYNNIYCMLEYMSDEVFIVEIYNNQLADMQKQLFDFVWDRAKRMKKVSKFGQTILA